MVHNEQVRRRMSYWLIFRVVFVIFSLYLLGDAFYRWDGFRYYASLYEFIPTAALVIILFCILSILATFPFWLIFKVIERFSKLARLEITRDHLLLSFLFFILLSIPVWIGKRKLLFDVQSNLQAKLIVFAVVVSVSCLLVWLFRRHASQWMEILQERITPLVWLFGSLTILSIPILTYHTWFKDTNKPKTIPAHRSKYSITDKNHPNIILVTFDALSEQNMSVYGYQRETTPFISEWSKNAFVFTRAKAASTYTTSATASLMTGKRVWTHQTYYVAGSKPVQADIENIALVLKKNGYYNMAFIANGMASVSRLGIEKSFDIAPPSFDFMVPRSLSHYVELNLQKWFGGKIRLYNWLLAPDFIFREFMEKISQDYSETTVPPEKAFDKFLTVIDKYDNLEPYFVWIHLFPPHDPYLPPKPFMGKFESSETYTTAHKQEIIWLSDKTDWKTARARYDEFIRYCDKQFDEFIRKLTKMGVLKNSIIILSADHGESFEHNSYGHGGVHLYEAVTNIPLIISIPRENKGKIIHTLVSQSDIPASILELVNIPIPSWMEGRSFVKLFKGHSIVEMPIFSMNLARSMSRGNPITEGIIAVWEGDYKLIHYLEEKKSLLFNIKKDPDELNNLFDKEAEVRQRLLKYVLDHLRDANERISSNKL